MPRSRTNTSLASDAERLAAERKALEELKALCQEHSVSWPKSDLVPDGPNQEDDTDAVLMRYLRARKLDVHAAFKQYEVSAKWRHDVHLEQKYDDVDIDKFEAIRRIQPQWTGRRDGAGVPIMVYVVSQVQAQDILALHDLDPTLSSVFLAAEYVTQFVQPLCGKLDERRITTSINIIDLSNVGVPTFWRLRKLLSIASNMATAHYPETVKRIYVVGAPKFFPTIWQFITAWFERETTRKIAVLGHQEGHKTLRRDLGAENLPRRFGGDLDWEFGMHPVLSPDTATVSEKLMGTWVDGPLRLTIDAEHKPRILAVGSRNGQLRRDELT